MNREQEKELLRAHEAQNLLQDRTLVAALDQIEAECERIWRTSEKADSSTRERCYDLIRATHLLRKVLTEWVDDGNVLAKKLLEERERGGRPPDEFPESAP